jgi:hypothetical protein
MAGPVPAIHDYGAWINEDVDARHKAGHDKIYGVTTMTEPRLSCATSMRRSWRDSAMQPAVGA